MGLGDDPSEPVIERNVNFIRRAIWMGNFRIENTPNFGQLDAEGADAVTVSFSYYGFLNLEGVNTPGTTAASGARFENVVSLVVPLATFSEEIRFNRKVATVRPQPLDFFPVTTNSLTQNHLDAIFQTYDLEGIYDFNGTPVYRNIPPSFWDQTGVWFAPGDLRNYSELTPTEMDLEVTVRMNNTSAMYNAGFGTVYNGVQTTFPIRAIPR